MLLLPLLTLGFIAVVTCKVTGKFGPGDLSTPTMVSMILELGDSVVSSSLSIPQFCYLSPQDNINGVKPNKLMFCRTENEELEQFPSLFDVITKLGTISPCVVSPEDTQKSKRQGYIHEVGSGYDMRYTGAVNTNRYSDNTLFILSEHSGSICHSVVDRFNPVDQSVRYLKEVSSPLPQILVNALRSAVEVIVRWNVISDGPNRMAFNNIKGLLAGDKLAKLLRGSKNPDDGMQQQLKDLKVLQEYYMKNHSGSVSLNNAMRASLDNVKACIDLVIESYKVEYIFGEATTPTTINKVAVMTNGMSDGFSTTISANNGVSDISCVNPVKVMEYKSINEILNGTDGESGAVGTVLFRFGKMRNDLDEVINSLKLLEELTGEDADKAASLAESSSANLCPRETIAFYAIITLLRKGLGSGSLPLSATMMMGDLGMSYIQLDGLAVDALVQYITLIQRLNIMLERASRSYVDPYVMDSHTNMFSTCDESVLNKVDLDNIVDLVKNAATNNFCASEGNKTGLFSRGNTNVCYASALAGTTTYISLLHDGLTGTDSDTVYYESYYSSSGRFPRSPSFLIAPPALRCLKEGRESARSIFVQGIMSKDSDGSQDTVYLKSIRSVISLIQHEVQRANSDIENTNWHGLRAAWFHPESSVLNESSVGSVKSLNVFPADWHLYATHFSVSTVPIWNSSNVLDLSDVVSTHADPVSFVPSDPTVLKLSAVISETSPILSTNSYINLEETDDPALTSNSNATQPQGCSDGKYLNCISMRCEDVPSLMMSPANSPYIETCVDFDSLLDADSVNPTRCVTSQGCSKAVLGSGTASSCSFSCVDKTDYLNPEYGLCFKLPAGLYNDSVGGVSALRTCGDLIGVRSFVFGQNKCNSFQRYDNFIPFPSLLDRREASMVVYLTLEGQAVDQRYSIMGLADLVELDIELHQDGTMTVALSVICDDEALVDESLRCADTTPIPVSEWTINASEVFEAADICTAFDGCIFPTQFNLSVSDSFVSVGVGKWSAVVYVSQFGEGKQTFDKYNKRGTARKDFEALSGLKYPFKDGAFIGTRRHKISRSTVTAEKSPTINVFEASLYEYQLVKYKTPRNLFGYDTLTLWKILIDQFLKPEEYVSRRLTGSQHNIWMLPHDVGLSQTCTVGSSLVVCDENDGVNTSVYEKIKKCKDPFTDINEFGDCVCESGSFSAVVSDAVDLIIGRNKELDPLLKEGRFRVAILGYTKTGTVSYDGEEGVFLLGSTPLTDINISSCKVKEMDCSQTLTVDGIPLISQYEDVNGEIRMQYKFTGAEMIQSLHIYSEVPLFVSVTLRRGSNHSSVLERVQTSEGVNGAHSYIREFVIGSTTLDSQLTSCVKCPTGASVSALPRLSLGDCLCSTTSRLDISQGQCVVIDPSFIPGTKVHKVKVGYVVEPDLMEEEFEHTTSGIKVYQAKTNERLPTTFIAYEDRINIDRIPIEQFTTSSSGMDLPNDPGRMYFVVAMTEDKSRIPIAPITLPCVVKAPSFFYQGRDDTGKCEFKLMNFEDVQRSMVPLLLPKVFLLASHSSGMSNFLEEVEMSDGMILLLDEGDEMKAVARLEQPSYFCSNSVPVEVKCEKLEEEPDESSIGKLSLITEELRNFIVVGEQRKATKHQLTAHESLDNQPIYTLDEMMVYSLFQWKYDTFMGVAGEEEEESLSTRVGRVLGSGGIFTTPFVPPFGFLERLYELDLDLTMLGFERAEPLSLPLVRVGEAFALNVEVFDKATSFVVLCDQNGKQLQTIKTDIPIVSIPELGSGTGSGYQVLHLGVKSKVNHDIFHFTSILSIDDTLFTWPKYEYKAKGMSLSISPRGSDFLLMFLPSSNPVGQDRCFREVKNMRLDSLANSLKESSALSPFVLAGDSTFVFNTKAQDICLLAVGVVTLPDGFAVGIDRPEHVVTLTLVEGQNSSFGETEQDEFLVPDGETAIYVEETPVVEKQNAAELVGADTLYFFIGAIVSVCVGTSLLIALVIVLRHVGALVSDRLGMRATDPNKKFHGEVGECPCCKDQDTKLYTVKDSINDGENDIIVRSERLQFSGLSVRCSYGYLCRECLGVEMMRRVSPLTILTNVKASDKK